MKQRRDDEARLVEYLLGQAAPDEQTRIEQRYLSDPDFHAEVQAAERDLIDQYVRGEIADPSTFETHFLSSPSRREKVAFARALMHSSARGAAVREHASPRHREWQLAAAIVVLLAGGWWLVSNRQPENRGLPAPGQQASSDIGASDSRAGETRPAPAQPEPAEPRPGPAPSLVATLILTPGLTRGPEEAPLLIVGDNVQIRLQLELEATGYQRYRAAIRTADGVEIWSEDRLVPERLNGGQVVTFTVPADRFADEDYTVRLSGITPSSDAEEAGGYYFRARLRR